MCFGKGIYADKVVERLLKNNKKWGARDRSFVAEHTYEMVRWWGLLWAIYDKAPNTKRKDLEKLFGVYWSWRGFELPDWPKFDSVRDLDIQARINAFETVAERESYPQWLDELASEQLGPQWPVIARAMNTTNSVNIRVNTLKATENEVLKELADAGLEVHPHPVFGDAFTIEGRPRLNNIEGFKNGRFEVQDAGSQTIAPYLNPEPGSVVIDACAGAGGKTLHLAQIMRNKGTLIAMDVEGRKLGELQKRVSRSGVNIVKTRAWEEKNVLEELTDTADYLLLDVPCSGTGVIKREPDTKWKLQPEHLERLNAVQADIIDRYPKMLKPGGTMVYATCSILPQENRMQVDQFLENHPEFELVEDSTVNPGEFNDGFYMAKIIRKA
jgi:16S rRNA (cytosine967-C5)-methyltransferase